MSTTTPGTLSTPSSASLYSPDLPVRPAPVCPVCATPAPWFDVVDFNKSCAEAKGLFLPLSGCPVYYARCENCDFCFAPELHHWSAQEMARRIYNAGYLSVDPDYVEARPQGSAQQLQTLFPLMASQRVAHLDYGSGSGRLAELLCNRGWRSTTYDPFVPGTVAPAAGQQFGLITAFEVFEHVAQLAELGEFLDRHLAPGGVLLVSTLLSDGAIKPGRRLDWWYASPRNGHISLFSQKSLPLMLGKCGVSAYASLSSGLHIACKQAWPVWAQHLIPHD